MSCDYCKRDAELADTYGEFGAYREGIYVEVEGKSRLYVEVSDGRGWTKTLHIPINYCPMCGDRLEEAE